MWPLSFKEFLKFKGVILNKNFAYSQIRFKIKKLLKEYVVFGGFPEVVLEDDSLKTAILKNYYDLIIYRDLVERFSIRNTVFLKSLSKYLLTNIATLFSVNAYYKNLEKPLKPAKETLLEYLSYLQEIGLIFLVPTFSYSLKTQQVNPKKNYVIDNGLRNAVSFMFSQDLGRLLENLVFIELKRRNKKIYYHKQKKECDFIVVDNQKISQAIQVSQELNKDNQEQEINGLVEAMQIYGVKQGLILVQDSDKKETKKINNCQIHIIPLWRWLLGLDNV
jgi:predicted AAA+ superfamily ATPase